MFTELRVARVLQKRASAEIRVHTAREAVLSDPHYDPVRLFFLLDTDRTGNITSKHLVSFLSSVGRYIAGQEDGQALVERYTRRSPLAADGIPFEDFLRDLEPNVSMQRRITLLERVRCLLTATEKDLHDGKYPEWSVPAVVPPPAQQPPALGSVRLGFPSILARALAFKLRTEVEAERDVALARVILHEYCRPRERKVDVGGGGQAHGAEDGPDHLLDLFRQADTLGNGQLTVEQLRSALSRVGVFLSAREMSTLLRRLDRNKDGRVSYAEFLTELLPVTSIYARALELQTPFAQRDPMWFRYYRNYYGAVREAAYRTTLRGTASDTLAAPSPLQSYLTPHHARHTFNTLMRLKPKRPYSPQLRRPMSKIPRRRRTRKPRLLGPAVSSQYMLRAPMTPPRPSVHSKNHVQRSSPAYVNSYLSTLERIRDDLNQQQQSGSTTTPHSETPHHDDGLCKSCHSPLKDAGVERKEVAQRSPVVLQNNAGTNPPQSAVSSDASSAVGIAAATSLHHQTAVASTPEVTATQEFTPWSVDAALLHARRRIDRLRYPNLFPLRHPAGPVNRPLLFPSGALTGESPVAPQIQPSQGHQTAKDVALLETPRPHTAVPGPIPRSQQGGSGSSGRAATPSQVDTPTPGGGITQTVTHTVTVNQGSRSVSTSITGAGRVGSMEQASSVDSSTPAVASAAVPQGTAPPQSHHGPSPGATSLGTSVAGRMPSASRSTPPRKAECIHAGCILPRFYDTLYCAVHVPLMRAGVKSALSPVDTKSTSRSTLSSDSVERVRHTSSSVYKSVISRHTLPHASVLGSAPAGSSPPPQTPAVDTASGSGATASSGALTERKHTQPSATGSVSGQQMLSTVLQHYVRMVRERARAQRRLAVLSGFSLAAAFENVDADHNGFITVDELQRVMKTGGYPLSEHGLQVALRLFDRNQDGRVSYREWVRQLLPSDHYFAQIMTQGSLPSASGQAGLDGSKAGQVLAQAIYSLVQTQMAMEEAKRACHAQWSEKGQCVGALFDAIRAMDKENTGSVSLYNLATALGAKCTDEEASAVFTLLAGVTGRITHYDLLRKCLPSSA